MSKEMVKKNIVSVIEDEAFVPLNEFELEECRKLVALKFAYERLPELNRTFVEFEQGILKNSTRFTRVRCSFKGAKLNQPIVFYEGYEDSDRTLVYIVCNNGKKLFFNDKCELVGRT